jgi:hypothetical protein
MMVSPFLTIFVLYYSDNKTNTMTTKLPPSLVKIIMPVVLDENHFSVNIKIHRPETNRGETTTKWDIYAFCNHNSGRLWDSKEAPILHNRLRAKIKSMKDFDAEYTYYKTLADELQERL